MGKLIGAAVEEAKKCAGGCRYYAAQADGVHASGDDRRSARRPRRGPVPAAGRGAGRDAVELSVLAGGPVRGARAGRRQRRLAQARVERSAVRAGAGGCVPARRRARGRVPDLAGGRRPRRRDRRRPPHGGRDGDRQRGRGQRRRRGGGQTSEEDGAGAGRQRRVHRAGQRRPAARDRDGGEGAHRQQRTIVHRRQAFHRRRRRVRPVRARDGGGDGGAEGGRPRRGRTRSWGRWRCRRSGAPSPSRSSGRWRPGRWC